MCSTWHLFTAQHKRRNPALPHWIRFGARHTPSTTPTSEGVYTITQASRETYLAPFNRIWARKVRHISRYDIAGREWFNSEASAPMTTLDDVPPGVGPLIRKQLGEHVAIDPNFGVTAPRGSSSISWRNLRSPYTVDLDSFLEWSRRHWGAGQGCDREARYLGERRIPMRRYLPFFATATLRLGRKSPSNPAPQSFPKQTPSEYPQHHPCYQPHHLPRPVPSTKIAH